MLFLDVIAIGSIGSVVGVEFAVSCFINPVIQELDDAARGEALRRFAALLGKVMPFWYGGNLVLLMVEAYLRRHTVVLPWMLGAVVVWAAVIVGTIAVLVPINNRVAASTGPMPEGLQREHRRWDMLHRWRVVLLVAAMVSFLLGVLMAR